MLAKLPEDPRRKFIWAEISYFSMWWDGLDEDEREKVKRYVDMTTWALDERFSLHIIVALTKIAVLFY